MPEVGQNEKFWIPTNFNQDLYFTHNDLSRMKLNT